MATIIIIGAGIGGLATANLLARDGHDVMVLEKNDQLGGRAGQFKKDGFTFDTGPSWYLMPEVFEKYYRLLDTSAKEQLDLVRLSPAYKVFSGAEHPITITGNLAHDSQTFESREPGAGKRLEKYVARSKQTYRTALDHFLYSNFKTKTELLHPEIIKHAGEFLTLATTPIHRHVSRSFKNPHLQQIMEYPMVFLGSSPFQAPALYSLMSALDFDEGVYYPKGTMYAIVESLLNIGRTLGVTYRTGMNVEKILVKDDLANGVQLVGGEQLEADIVLSNADLHFTETQLLEKPQQTYPENYWQKKQASPSALLMYLGIEGKVPEFEHHTLVFTADWKQNFEAIFTTKTIPKPASIYVSKTSQTDATAPEGNENIFVLVPLPAGISLSNTEQETLADEYLQQLFAMTGVDLKSRTISRTLFGPNQFADKYNAWQSTMLGPSHKLGQSAFFRTPNVSKKVRNLFYVGASTVPGIGVPMCLISAELVAQRIANYVKAPKV
jgi:1-hydroxy-2-isopentenylcarotenoid 3,4-desaturase